MGGLTALKRPIPSLPVSMTDDQSFDVRGLSTPSVTGSDQRRRKSASLRRAGTRSKVGIGNSDRSERIVQQPARRANRDAGAAPYNPAVTAAFHSAATPVAGHTPMVQQNQWMFRNQLVTGKPLRLFTTSLK